MKQFLLSLSVLSIVNSAVSAAPTNDQLYNMYLELKSEQQELKKQVIEAKNRESQLRNELSQTKAELLAANKQLDESFIKKQKKLNLEKGFFASAGGIYVRPIIDTDSAINHNELDYEPGFQVSAGYQAADNWDYTFKYKHLSAYESNFSAIYGIIILDSLAIYPASVISEYKINLM